MHQYPVIWFHSVTQNSEILSRFFCYTYRQTNGIELYIIESYLKIARVEVSVNAVDFLMEFCFSVRQVCGENGEGW